MSPRGPSILSRRRRLDFLGHPSPAGVKHRVKRENGYWKSLDFLGFSSQIRHFSMGYDENAREKNSRAAWGPRCAEMGRVGGRAGRFCIEGRVALLSVSHKKMRASLGPSSFETALTRLLRM